MKTFDLALKYLQGTDFTPFDLKNSEKDIPLTDAEKKMGEDLIERQKKFKSDQRVLDHNDYYKDTIFIFAIYHLAFKSKGIISAWDVALEIVESELPILKTNFEKYQGSVYPEIMVDKWNSYCKTKPEIDFLKEDSQLKTEFFFAAYHYIVDAEFA